MKKQRRAKKRSQSSALQPFKASLIAGLFFASRFTSRCQTGKVHRNTNNNDVEKNDVCKIRSCFGWHSFVNFGCPLDAQSVDGCRGVDQRVIAFFLVSLLRIFHGFSFYNSYRSSNSFLILKIFLSYFSLFKSDNEQQVVPLNCSKNYLKYILHDRTNLRFRWRGHHLDL